MSVIKLAKSIFSIGSKSDVKDFYKLLQRVNAAENEFSRLTNDQIFAKTAEFRDMLAKGATLDNIMPAAFAAVREVAKRQLGMRHFDVQIIGGMVLHSGAIAEMKTGEGKTLVATLPAYLNALSGQSVHVVTVNDYLTKRDSEWMSVVYNALGIRVGHILSDMSARQRQDAYAADITYSTNNELGFDYLRDNMCLDKESIVQRAFGYAVIDEVDSILVDEARTPLIISDSIDYDIGAYAKLNKFVASLTDSDYSVDEKDRHVFLTDSGINKLEGSLRKAGMISGNGDLYSIENLGTLHYTSQLLKAHRLFELNRDYIVKDGRIVIIDEFTGRMMHGRRFSDGLHQAIEAKENVEICSETQTLASITFQNYFRMYPKISGMTATAITEKDEFRDIYNLKVIQIPTHMPVCRKDYDDVIYKTEQEKFDAIVELIKQCSKKNQPVLVGTVSIEKSEKLSAILHKEKLEHQVLNAKYHEKEAHIIAQAGCPGVITIATNMAGRGTDIKLGGNADMAFADYIANQNLSEAEVDVNSEEFKAKKATFYKKFELQKQQVLDAGGLYVIGTERHESRRIDNQLRGRSGRQGDVGSSKFFISLEDDLMRIFGSDKIAGVLTKVGLKHGEAIQHPWINKTIQKAQRKIEVRNYELRKNVMRFDDIVNEQRCIIFKQRTQLINAGNEEILESFETIREQVNSSLVAKLASSAKYPEDWDTEGFDSHFKRLYGFSVDIAPWLTEDAFNVDVLLQRINDITAAHFCAKISSLGQERAAVRQRRIWLVIIGKVWSENLAYLDDLRSGIHLRAMGNKDPFVEYSKEAFTAFNACLLKIDESCLMSFSRMEVDSDFVMSQPAVPATLLVKRKKTAPHARDPEKPQTWGAVSRNEQCPCCSGKKFKHCCGVL